jgi:FdhE protein
MLPQKNFPTAVTPVLLLAPAADVFGRRAARFRQLAAGHSLGPWLQWLAVLSEVQQAVASELPDLVLPEGEQQPLLGDAESILRCVWPAVFEQLAARMPGLGKLDAMVLEQEARNCLKFAAGESVTAARARSGFVVAAAMQVVWSSAARQVLQRTRAPFVKELSTCPCCGSVASGSIIMAGEGKAGLRYLECSLCATRWNAVRARCTLCEQGAVVNYVGLEGAHAAVQAETCDCCKGYIKTFMQTSDIAVEPAADDLASLALDVLVGEHGFARGAPNLFLADGEAV